MRGSILVRVDGNELAEAALPYAEELALRLSSEVALLHVRSSGAANEWRFRRIYLERLTESVESHIEQQSAGRSRPR